jgi:hypothetical protein
VKYHGKRGQNQEFSSTVCAGEDLRFLPHYGGLKGKIKSSSPFAQGNFAWVTLSAYNLSDSNCTEAAYPGVREQIPLVQHTVTCEQYDALATA